MREDPLRSLRGPPYYSLEFPYCFWDPFSAFFREKTPSSRTRVQIQGALAYTSNKTVRVEKSSGK